jgi:succinate dehydrogenase / fumarate reductase cytochrome b subunit
MTQNATHRSATARVAGRGRPAFFDLFAIRFPVTAIVSIAHRVSGVFLALLIPMLAFVLQRTLAGADTYAGVAAAFQATGVRIVALLAVWALAHHAAAGVRHLLFDIEVGTRLGPARASAWAVFAIEAIVVLSAIGALW